MNKIDIRERQVRGLKYLGGLSIDDICLAPEYYDIDCTQYYRDTYLLFPLGFVLHGISALDSDLKKEVAPLADSLITKLLNEANENATYNYWIRDSDEYKRTPLPDDLDDAACAWAALLRAGQEVDEKVFLATIKIETSPGGPYTTWYIDRKKVADPGWNDLDPVVNANFLYFAKLYGISLPKTRQHCVERLNQGDYSSPYYPYDLVFILNLSRFASIEPDVEISTLLSNRLNGYRFSELDDAEKLLLLLCKAYLDLKISSEELDQVLSLQQSDGSLPTYTICNGYALIEPKGQTFVGNPAISTALFVELLQLIGNTPSSSASSSNKPPHSNQIADCIETINRELEEVGIKEQFSKLSSLTAKLDSTALISPWYIASDISPESIDKEVARLKEFTLAMFYGWSAYTLMDDILDSQEEVSLVPMISTLQLLSQRHSRNISSEFFLLIEESFMRTDRYYEWEIRNCRFRDRQSKIKSQKAVKDHTYILERMNSYLSAISYLPKILGLSSQASKNLQDFFEPLLLIKQLNDDAHDWGEDLSNGIMTSTLSLLLADNIDSDRKALQKKFLKEVLPQIINDCEIQYERATEALNSLHNKPRLLSAMLDQVYVSTLDKKRSLAKADNIVKMMKQEIT